MADENIEQIIERTIKVYLEAEGIQDVTRGVSVVKKKLDETRKEAQKTGKAIGVLNDRIKEYVGEFVDGSKDILKAQKNQQKETAKTAKIFKGLTSTVGSMFGEIGSGLKKLSGLGGFGGLIEQAVRYDKELIKLSASTSRLGIGTKSLESKIVNMSKTFSLTRKEVMSLFSEFDKSYKFVGVKEFESLLGIAQKMVGSNQEAIQQLMSAVGGLSQKYMGLAKQLVVTAKSGSDADKARLASRFKMLYLTDKLGEAEYRVSTAILRGNDLVGPEEKKRQEEAKKRIETMNSLKIMAEDVAIGFGQTILPLLEKVSEWLKKMTNDGREWGSVMAAAITMMVGLDVGKFLGKKALGFGLKSAAMGAGGLFGIGRKGLNKIPGGLKALPSAARKIPLLLASLKNPLGIFRKSIIGLGSVSTKAIKSLGGFGPALGKAALAVGVAVASYQIGKAVYKKIAKPGIEKAFKGMEEGNGFFASAGKWGINKMFGAAKQGRTLSPSQEKSYRERIAKKRKEAESQESRITQQIKSQKKAIEEAAQAEEKRLIYTKDLADFSSKIKELKESEKSLLSAEVERMRLTGEVNLPLLDKSKNRAFKAIDAEVEATKRYITTLRNMQAQNFGGGTGDFARTSGWSQDVIDALDKIDVNMKDILDPQRKIIEAETILAQKTKDRFQILEQIATVYDSQIKSASLLAEESSLLVQIADSYAIGIGASAQMRMREFNALQQQGAEMEKQLQKQMSLYSQMEAGDARLALGNQIKENENAILQIQLKQAGVVKSLRDGWVEAIQSMNTGAGTFTKIILDQNKGTAQALRLAGDAATVSAMSGSLVGGYATSERFSGVQGAAGQGLISGAGGKRSLAYQTTIGKRLGLEAGGVQWMARGKAQRDLAKRNTYAARGGAVSAAFGASPLYEGSLGVGGFDSANLAMSGGQGINVNINLSSNAQQTGADIVRVVVPEIQRIFHQVSGGVLDGVKFRR